MSAGDVVLKLTVGREKRQPENDGYIAIITKEVPVNFYTGSATQTRTTVLTLEVVPNMVAAKKWFRRMQIEKPWELEE